MRKLIMAHLLDLEVSIREASFFSVGLEADLMLVFSLSSSDILKFLSARV
jgi:hypothetical protein